MNQNEIVLYHTDTKECIEVTIENETVWLNRKQLSLLFDRDIKTIGKHINNALSEELQNISVVANFATTASDGKKYNVEYYNLDIILSVGYRVKSQRGVLFRIWANTILKDYLLKGYAIQSSIKKLEHEVRLLQDKSEKFDLYIQGNLSPKQGIFFDGQVFDAYSFVADISRLANHTIILVDNYIDDTVLTLLSKRKNGVKAIVYTKSISKQLELDLQKHTTQYSPITVKTYSKSHDRFLIIDNCIVYHIGASLKDLGNKWFAFSKLEFPAKVLLEHLNIKE